MADEVYAIKGVRKTCASHAAKISVLWPIMGRRSLHDNSVIADISALLGRWRLKLEVLKAKGWPDLQGIGKLQFARNCPLYGVKAFGEKTLRPCKLWAICPWCYMRQVERLFNKVAVYLPKKGSWKNSKLNLLEVSGQLLLRKADAGKYISGHLMEWMKVPNRLLKRLQPLGAYRHITVDPKLIDKQYRSWRFSYRILAIVPEGWMVPEWLTNGKRKVRLNHIQSRKALVNIVSRTCRYPSGLLRGDGTMAMVSLNARKGKRLSEYVGCLRGVGGDNDNNEKDG